MTTHRINCAEIEIQAGEVALAERLIERLSLLHERRIAPLLDRVCSELSGPERLDRIDRLELDLGLLAVDDFDDDFLRKLEAALRAALAKRLAKTRGAEQREQASLELIEAFARTGNLPWWADRSEPELVAGHVRVLLAAAPRELLRLVRAIAGDALALARMARHCDGALLAAIVARTHPELHAELLAGIHELERLLGPAGSNTEPSRAMAVRARSAVLAVLARADVHEPEPMLRAVVHELISSWPQALAVLAASERASAAPPWLRGAMQDAGVSLTPGAAPLPAPGTEREPRPEHEQSPGSHEAGAPARPTSRERPARSPSARKASEREPALHQHEREPALHQHERDPALHQHEREPALHQHEHEREPALHQHERELPSIQTARRRALEQLEQLYVNDAGLVLLWPFLDRFFARAGLLDQHHRFIDEHATMQALALLEQLAIEDPEPPEFLLPLAKVLCGLAPEAGFALERPLAPEQLDECERLLAAAIGHAPILRDMPVASFRATFLQRPGVLSTRDGAWLLQVERHAHDLVLDRFPWSWSWIKLPWMPHPLQVEW